MEPVYLNNPLKVLTKGEHNDKVKLAMRISVHLMITFPLKLPMRINAHWIIALTERVLGSYLEN